MMHDVYFSKKLLPQKKNYSISELECLAIVEALDNWRDYLYGKKLTVITDHQALKWIGKIKKLNSRLFEWSLKSGQYDFEIQYKSEKTNVEANAPSRSPILDDFSHDDHLKIINLVEGRNFVPKVAHEEARKKKKEKVTLQ